MRLPFAKKEPGSEETTTPNAADFLGNPSRAEGDFNPRYRRGWMPVGTSVRLVTALSVFSAIQLGLVLTLVVRDQMRTDTKPLVFMQTELGKLVPVPTLNVDPDVPLLEAFLHHLVSNLMEVRNGEIKKAGNVRHLMDARAYDQIVSRLVNGLPRLRNEKAVISASISRIDTSAPERFVINRRLRRSLGVAYGDSLTVTGSGGGHSRTTRWDFEIVIVPRTVENSWGLFAVQLNEVPLTAPFVVIPPDLRRPEDLISTN